jgi:hypothetical protein
MLRVNNCYQTKRFGGLKVRKRYPAKQIARANDG